MNSCTELCFNASAIEPKMLCFKLYKLVNLWNTYFVGRFNDEISVLRMKNTSGCEKPCRFIYIYIYIYIYCLRTIMKLFYRKVKLLNIPEHTRKIEWARCLNYMYMYIYAYMYIYIYIYIYIYLTDNMYRYPPCNGYVVSTMTVTSKMKITLLSWITRYNNNSGLSTISRHLNIFPTNSWKLVFVQCVPLNVINFLHNTPTWALYSTRFRVVVLL